VEAGFFEEKLGVNPEANKSKLTADLFCCRTRSAELKSGYTKCNYDFKMKTDGWRRHMLDQSMAISDLGYDDYFSFCHGAAAAESNASTLPLKQSRNL